MSCGVRPCGWVGVVSVLGVSTPVPPSGLYSQPSQGLPPSLADRPVEAADPAVLTDGQVIPRQVVPAPKGGGSFSVDVDRAPAVLRDLENARRELADLKQDALRLGRVDPSSGDEVSKDAAAVLGAVAVGGPGSLLEALDAGTQQLDELINAIRGELDAYRRSDEVNRDRLAVDRA
jgi:hypothetical protein